MLSCDGKSERMAELGWRLTYGLSKSLASCEIGAAVVVGGRAEPGGNGKRGTQKQSEMRKRKGTAHI
jgi:hypothetical protein